MGIVIFVNESMVVLVILVFSGRISDWAGLRKMCCELPLAGVNKRVTRLRLEEHGFDYSAESDFFPSILR